MRKGDEDAGEDCTRTRCAEGVLSGCSTSASKNRYARDRQNAKKRFQIEKATRSHVRAHA